MAMRVSGARWWRGLLLLAGVLAACPLAARGVQTTSVQDKVYRADGTLAQGTLLVSWPSFLAADGSTVAAGSTSVTIAQDGSVTLALAPNEGAEPAGSYYTAVYHLNDGTVLKEYWVVPQTATATIGQMRTKVVPAAVAQQSVSRQYVDASESALQSQLTQYVNTHAGSGSVTLPTGLVKGNGTSVAAAASASDVTALFHSMQTKTTYYLQTSFKEGAAGTTLQGTKPAVYTGPDTGWHFGDPATAWNFETSGGVTAPTTTGAPYTGGAYIDIGQSTGFTVNINYTNIGSMSLVIFRYTDPNDLVFANLTSGDLVAFYSQVGGVQTLISGQEAMDMTSLHFAVSGQTITATDDAGHSPLIASIPAGVNTSGTKVGFATYAGSGGVVSSFSVSSVSIQQQSACAGYLNADNTCSGTGTSVLTAYDAAGHLSYLPEVQVSTGTSGFSSIVCQEDLSKGVFDARCPKYGSGGIYGTNSGQALQDLRNAVTCYQAETGKHASVSLPPGQFHVGTPTQPTLDWPSGTYLTGVPNGEGTSTFLLATYNNYNVFQVNTGQTAVCSDGQTHTNPLTNGSTKYLAAYGCGAGGCVNFPGDTGSYPSGGPNQGGMFIGDSQGDEEHLGAFNNGSYGIQADGQDSQFRYLFTTLNNEWLLYGKDQPGQTYDPTTDGVHADVELTGVDNQVDHVEAYGTFGTPGREYGHLALVGWAGGNTQLSDLFLQVGQIGLYRSFANGGFGRLVNSRFDYMHGESIVTDGGGDVYSNLAIDGYCDNQAVITALGGHCDGIDVRGGGNTFTDLIMGKNNGQFQNSVATGDVYAFLGGNFGSGTEGLNFEYPITAYRGTSTSKTFLQGFAATTGDDPDVSVYNHIQPNDSAATTLTGVGKAFIGQDVWVYLTGGNDMLESSVNGGHWQTCNGSNVTQSGIYHFVVIDGTRYGDPAVLQEQCDVPQNLTIRPAPATSTDSCNDADFTFGAGPAKVGGFGIYRCHPANTWTFYPLTPTSF